jgi:fructokinase
VSGAHIVGLGELLWDQLPGPGGTTNSQLGGAPANFAVACGRLGGRAHVASAVGHDALGERALAVLKANGADTSFVQRSEQPTSEVLVKLDAAGQATYDIVEPVAWDALEWTPHWERLAQEADAVYFGTLAQRNGQSRDTIRRLVVETRLEAVRVFDVNLRNPYWDDDVLAWGLQHATILKLNEDELPLVLQAMGQSTAQDEATGSRTLLDFGTQSGSRLKLVCVTLGGRGCLLTTHDQQVRAGGFPTKVVDTIGAGDAFTAALVTYWLQERPLRGIAAAANRLGSYVASQAGAMPEFPPELLAELDGYSQGGQ